MPPGAPGGPGGAVAGDRRPVRAIEAAVFDMDGLLVDSEPLWHEVEIAVFGRHGVPLTVELCRQTKGMFVGDVARHWFARAPWEGATPEDVAAEVVEAMAGVLGEEAALKPGVLHALGFCRAKGVRMALASSSPRRLIDVVVGRHGLAGWFSVVHSAEHEVAGKPHPAVFLHTARLLGTHPSRCVVFEDAAAGVHGAKAAGMVCVAVPEGRGAAGEPPPGFAGADVVLGSLEELDDALWARLAALPPAS